MPGDRNHEDSRLAQRGRRPSGRRGVGHDPEHTRGRLRLGLLVRSDNGDDEVITGPGGSWAFGANSTSAGGDDDLQAKNGVRDIVWCGNGNEVARVDVVDDSLEELFGGFPYGSCEQVIEF